jgi:carotenoid cleavage dioxygenase-like enzyme
MPKPITLPRRHMMQAVGAVGLVSTAPARRAGAEVPKAPPTDDPFLSGYYAPIHSESEEPDLKIDGDMPKALHGTLYRNGPNPQFAPRGPYHWFDGDGMIHAFHFENGRVSYLNRWVRTPKWLTEHEAGESLFGGLDNPRDTDPRVAKLNSTTANTNIVWHAGRLMALEEGHAPFRLDPASLAPKGFETYGDKVKGPFTAHPKFDPQTGEMIFFGYSAKGPFTPFVSLHIADKDGNITRAEMLEIPFASMIHDFAVTKSWIIVPVFPLTGSLERAKSGRPPFAWEPDKGTHIAFVPRDGTVAGVKWVTLPPCYVFHAMNHYDTIDGRTVIDVMKYDVAPLFPRPDGSASTKAPSPSRLFRWSFDLVGKGKAFHELQLDERVSEFPRIDDRLAMADYRHGWAVTANTADSPRDREQGRQLTHYDVKSGKDADWRPARGDHVGEPVFVPRSLDTAEGDGWVLSVIYRAAEARSDLAVFEATNIARGPVALAHLSGKVPAGFHGNWRAGPL